MRLEYADVSSSDIPKRIPETFVAANVEIELRLCVGGPRRRNANLPIPAFAVYNELLNRPDGPFHLTPCHDDVESSRVL